MTDAATPPAMPARSHVPKVGAPDLAGFTSATKTAIAQVDDLISEYTAEIDKLRAVRRHMAECIGHDRTPGATGFKAATEAANRGLNETGDEDRRIPKQAMGTGAGR